MLSLHKTATPVVGNSKNLALLRKADFVEICISRRAPRLSHCVEEERFEQIVNTVSGKFDDCCVKTCLVLACSGQASVSGCFKQVHLLQFYTTQNGWMCILFPSRVLANECFPSSCSCLDLCLLVWPAIEASGCEGIVSYLEILLFEAGGSTS